MTSSSISDIEGDLFDACLPIIAPVFTLIPNQGDTKDFFTLDDYLVCLGRGFVGVTQLPADCRAMSFSASIQRACALAVRFNLQRGGSEDGSRLKRMAPRAHELCGAAMSSFTSQPRRPALPAQGIHRSPGLTAEGFDGLLWLLECGVKVKATRFGGCDFNAAKALRQIDTVSPEALIFGMD